MKRKGFFVALIAALMLATIAGTVIYSMSSTEAGKAQSHAAEIVELKRIWQNTRHLLDKAAADEMATQSVENGCVIPRTFDLEDKFDEVTDVVFTETLIDCKVTNNVSRISSTNPVSFDVKLKCRMEKNEFSVEFTKEFLLAKNVVKGTNTITVIDAQSNKTDVTKPCS